MISLCFCPSPFNLLPYFNVSCTLIQIFKITRKGSPDRTTYLLCSCQKSSEDLLKGLCGFETLKIKKQHHLEQTTKQASNIPLYEIEQQNQQILSYVTLTTEQVDLYDPLIAMLDFIMFKIKELKAACSKTEERILSVMLITQDGFCRKMTKIHWFNIFIGRHLKTQFSLHHRYVSEQVELIFPWKGRVISLLSATQGVNRKLRLDIGIRGNDSIKMSFSMQTLFLLLQMETSHSLANRCPCLPSRNTSFAGIYAAQKSSAVAQEKPLEVKRSSRMLLNMPHKLLVV